MGVIHIRLAKVWGGILVVATDINGTRKRMALEFGADAVFDAREDVAKKFRELNDGWGAEIVDPNAMAPSAVQQAMDSVEKGGTILVFGLGGPDQTMNIPLGQFLAGEISVIHSYSGGPVDSHRGFELIKSGQIDVGKMITHRLPLEEAQEGFRLTAEAWTPSGARCTTPLRVPTHMCCVGLARLRWKRFAHCAGQGSAGWTLGVVPDMPPRYLRMRAIASWAQMLIPVCCTRRVSAATNWSWSLLTLKVFHSLLDRSMEWWPYP